MRTRAWVKVTANSKPHPKKVINVQHVIKIYQALPLLRFSQRYYCARGEVLGSRLGHKYNHVDKQTADVNMNSAYSNLSQNKEQLINKKLMTNSTYNNK